MEHNSLHVAYFSMEFAFDDRFMNYAGGLGVLAADTAYSCADLEVPSAFVTLWYHQNDDTTQALDPSVHMKKEDVTVEVQIEDRIVKLSIWRYEVTGASGHTVPVFFLSAFNPENTRWDATLPNISMHLTATRALGKKLSLVLEAIVPSKRLGIATSSTIT
jgi:starch phosphorylase